MSAARIVSFLLLIAQASLSAQSSSFEHRGQTSGERLGASMAVLGDLDGDGFDDFLFGTGHDRVDLISGGTGALLDSVSGINANDDFGVAVAAIGDIDFDGVVDFAVGAPQRGNGGAGYVRLYSGASRLVIRTHFGSSAADRFGETLLNLGDTDADGICDLAVGAPTAEHFGNQVGRVEIFSGFTGANTASLLGVASNDFFGSALAAVGDVDGDGAADLLVGAPTANIPPGAFFGGPGGVYLYSGQLGVLLAQWTGAAADDRFGDALVSLGDLDGDGDVDFAVGAPGSDLGGLNAGAVTLQDVAGNSLGVLTGGSAGGGFGTTLAHGGDFDGDGSPEILVGAPLENTTVPGGGSVEVISPLFPLLRMRLEGDAVFGNLGRALLALDCDGDGRSEVLVSDPGAGSPLASGRVRLFGPRPILGAAAGSRVGELSGAAEDILTVNGSTGGPARRVDLGIQESIMISLAQPSGNPAPARFVLFGISAAPRFERAFDLPYGLGSMAFPPCVLMPYAEPYLFVVADGIGGMPCTPLATATPTPWNVLAGGIAASADFTLQGVVEGDGGLLQVTNAVILHVD